MRRFHVFMLVAMAVLTVALWIAVFALISPQTGMSRHFRHGWPPNLASTATPGPRNPAESLTPFTLLPDQAADLTLVWAWDGEPFGVLMVGVWGWGIKF